MAAGAGICIATSWFASAVTGQEFTWRDAGIAALSGGVSYFGGTGLGVGGLINGIYSGYTAFENGANILGIVGSGVSSFLLSIVSFGNLSQAGDDLAGIAISGFIDLVFGTGFSSMDAAISRTLTENNQRSTSSTNNALDIVRRKEKVSTTRIINGQAVTVGKKNCSYPGSFYSDLNGIYCYVRI